MAFDTIPPAWLDVGDPTKKELFDRMKANEDDLDNRISDVEAALTSETPIQFQVDGQYWRMAIPITGASPTIRIPFNITLTSALLHVVDDGSSGTLDCDVQRDSGGGFSTIFSVRPTLTFGGGANSTSTGTLSVTDIDVGDFLRMDIITTQIDNESFNLYLTWEVRL